MNRVVKLELHYGNFIKGKRSDKLSEIEKEKICIKVEEMYLRKEAK